MYSVPRTSLTLPAVVGRRLNEGLGVSEPSENTLQNLNLGVHGCG